MVNPKTGERIAVLKGFADPVTVTAFSPNGKLLATGNDRELLLWDAEKLKLVRKLDTPAGWVAFEPGGKTLLTAKNDVRGADRNHVVTRWDLTTFEGKPLPPLSNPPGYIHFYLSPDGKTLYSHIGHGPDNKGERYVRAYDAATGKELFPRQGHVGEVWAVAVSPDGRSIASGGADGAVRLWDLAGWKAGEAQPPVRALTGHAATVYSVAFSPDGKLVASASQDGTLRLWDTATGATVRTIQGPAARDKASAVAFSADGKILAAGAEDGSVRLWDVATGEKQSPLRWHNRHVTSVAFSPDNRFLASASSHDRKVHVTDRRTFRRVQTLGSPGAGGVGMKVALGGDGRTLAYGGWDGTIRLWNLEEKKETVLTGGIANLDGLALGPTGRFVAATAGGALRFWDRNSPGRPLVIGPSPFGSTARHVAFTPEGRYVVVAGFNGTVSILRTPTPPPPYNPDPARFARLLEGKEKPASARESLNLAELCQRKGMNAAAARFAAAAFTADPRLIDDPGAGHRYRAACYAALAAAGQGEDAATKDKERARLRRQALDWLRADLALWAMQLESARATGHAAVQERLKHWQQDSDLAGLRDRAALAKLSAGERAACEKLWADVAALLTKARAPRPREGVAGRPDPSLRRMEETLERQRAELGPNHPDTLRSMNNLGVVYWRTGQLDKSVPLFEQLLKIHEAKLGRNHPDTLRAVANLGVNYKDAGRLEEAVPLLEEAYRAAKKHPQLGWVRMSLLEAYAKAGANGKVAGLLQEQLSEARKTLPRDSPQLAGMLAQVGLSLLELKLWSEAEPLLRESLAIRAKTQANVWTTFNAQSMLGGALLGQKKYAEAEPLLLKGYAGMKERERSIPPQGKVRFKEAVERLVQLYEATGKKGEAAKWRAELPQHPASALAQARAHAARKEWKQASRAYVRVIDHPSPDWGHIGFEYAAVLLLADDREGQRKVCARLVEKSGQYGVRPYHVARACTLAPDSYTPAQRPGELAMPELKSAGKMYWSLWLQGSLHCRAGRYREALPLLRKSLDGRTPAGAGGDATRLWLALTLHRLGQTEEAKQEFARAEQWLKQFPDGLPRDARERLGVHLHDWLEFHVLHREVEALFPELAAREATLRLIQANVSPLLKTAALQAWFGQDRELAATCARALEAGKDTKNPKTAERVAKICSLRPSDGKTHEAALVLARRAVELGKGHAYLPYFQMCLGMAEYRSGHYAAAEAALLAASRLGARNHFVSGTSAFYRAMSLFRQGKEAEARKLAAEAVARMKPLPRDEKNPLAGNANADDLILWMAYKEARTLLQLTR